MTDTASISLYVGDLHPDITEQQIYDAFIPVAPVVSIRVCRDAVTRRSLGYGYINFISPEAAERALEVMNYQPLKDRPMRLMWSQRNPSLRKGGDSNIFIKNLAKNVDSKTLFDTFSEFGQILSCKVATDENGNSRGFAFVHFKSQEAAQSAVSKVNQKVMAGKILSVVPWKSKKERIGAGENKWTNIYVKNVSKSLTDAQFQKLWEKFGEVTSCVVVRDAQGNSKGFGFVNFASNIQAQKAIDAMNKTEVDGNELFVGRAQKKAEREKHLKSMFEQLKRERMSRYQGVNLYVKNLNETVDDDILRNLFSNFGTITSAKIARDDNGNSKGFGFVCFATPDEATRAVSEMNQFQYEGKPLFVALAQRKDARRAQLEMQHARNVNYPRIPGGPFGPLFYGASGPAPGRGAPVQRGRGGVQGYPGRGGKGGKARQIAYNATARNMQQPDIRQTVGEQIFGKVMAYLQPRSQQTLAGKITGMILEASESIESLMNIQQDSLVKLIEECLKALKEDTNN